MATAAQFSVNVKEVGVTTVIPDNDVARLMYYLRCVTVSVGVDILDNDLVDYKNYWRLSSERRARVLEAALLISPDEVIDKLIFRDDDGTVIKGTAKNEFCNISVACDVVSLQQNIIVAGRSQKVDVVMFFKSSWLDEFYIRPFARAVLGSKHCVHCAGKDGMCTCDDECPRNSDSQCKPLLGMLIESLAGASIRSPSRSSTPTPPEKSSTAHQCICDGCYKRDIEGKRYRCAVCDDYDLCETCYRKNVHDMSHRFMQFDRPGSLPVVLAPRTPPPEIPTRRTPQPPPAPPKPKLKPTPATHTNTASPYFYNDMTVAELKEYLKGNGVDHSDILDRETLCRKTWETHCECMSMTELTTFLTENNVSTAGCRDVTSRRQKAKEAFQIIRPAEPKQLPRVRKNDVVTLTRLGRAEMNGKRATIVQPDCGGGRAEVRLEGSGKTYKVKMENLVVRQESDDFLN